MYRVVDPEANTLSGAPQDSFEVWRSRAEMHCAGTDRRSYLCYPRLSFSTKAVSVFIHVPTNRE
jgi:hypothetical protein